MAKAIGEKIAYRKSSNFLRTWSDGQGEICNIEGVALSMSRPAPRVTHGAEKREVAPRAARTPPAAKRKSDDPYVNLLHTAIDAAEAMGKFSRWLKTPPPPAPPKPETAPPAVKTVPPFDIQDIPQAMRKLGMPMSAKLQERWFAGKANYSKSAEDLRNEIGQDGLPYAPAMTEMTMIKMEWVLSFRRAKEAFDELLKDRLRSPKAIDILKDKLWPHRNRREIQCWDIVNGNFLEFHKNYQFQRMEVNSTWGQRMQEFQNRARFGGVPDDLTGALGAFNFYAAARYVYFEQEGRVAVVPEISVYVRDPYDFTTEQYLGHWNSRHVAVVVLSQMADLAGLEQNPGWLKKPIVESNNRETSVLYPITNKDYRDWRAQHDQGGDFIIYTDRLNVKLDPPIRLAF